MLLHYIRLGCLLRIFWNRTLFPSLFFLLILTFWKTRASYLAESLTFWTCLIFSWWCVNSSSIEPEFYLLSYFSSSVGPGNWVISQGKIHLKNGATVLSITRMGNALKVRLHLVTVIVTNIRAQFHWEC